MTEEHVLDLAKAEQFLHMYRRGAMTEPVLRLMLTTACGVPEHLVNGVIEDMDATPMHVIEEHERQNEEARRTLGNGPTMIIEG